MKKPAEADTVRSLREIFERLSREAPTGSCSLEIQEKTKERGLALILTPVHDDAARIHAEFDPDFGIYLSLGKGSVFDLPYGRRYYSSLGFLEELEGLCRAAMIGQFRERVTLVGAQVVGASSEVVFPGPQGPTATEAWRRLKLFPFRKKTEEVLVYKPYRAS